jgi:hypothetical protein
MARLGTLMGPVEVTQPPSKRDPRAHKGLGRLLYSKIQYPCVQRRKFKFEV